MVITAKRAPSTAIVHRERSDHFVLAHQRDHQDLFCRHPENPIPDSGFQGFVDFDAKRLGLALLQGIDQAGRILRRQPDRLQVLADHRVTRHQALPAENLPLLFEKQEGRSVIADVVDQSGEQSLCQAIKIHFAVKRTRKSVEQGEFIEKRMAFLLQGVALDSALKRQFHVRRVPGLGDISVDTAIVDGASENLDITIRGHQHTDGVGIDVAYARQEFDARHARHPLVREHESHGILIEDPQAFLGRRGGQDLEIPLESEFEDPKVFRFIIDIQDRKFPVVE